MNRVPTFLGLIAPIASIFFALAGVFLLRAQLWTTGAVSVLIAMVALIADLRFFDRLTFDRGQPGELRLRSIPAALWVTAIWLNGVATFQVAAGSGSSASERLAAVAWICSVLIGLLTAWISGPHSTTFDSIARRISAHRRELILLLGVVMVAIVVRTFELAMHPYPWSGDEASVAREASRIVSGDTNTFFRTGWSDQPYWSFVPTATIQFLVVGDGILAARLTSVLIGTLAVVAVYIVGRELFDGVVAVMAAAFLATLPYHVHFSRLGFQNIVDSLMSSVAVWLAVRAVKTNDPRYYYTTGAVAGLTIYSYAGTRLVLVLTVVTLLYYLYRDRSGERRRGLHLLFFLGGATLSAAPQAVFFLMNPARFLSRLGQESILLNGWLLEQGAATGGGVPRILWDQFTTTVLTFVALPAWGHIFNSPYPYLTLPESLLFFCGMGSALAWLWTPRYFILLFWFWTVIVFGGMLTMNPPANTRLLMTTPVVALLMAIGVQTIFAQSQKRGLVSGRMFVPVCVVIASAIACQNIHFYLFEYRQQMYFRDANAEYAMEVGIMARGLGEDFHLYILGAPRVFSSFPTLRYATPRNPLVDLTNADIPGLELQAGTRAAFFATPENRALLADIQRIHAGGSAGVMHRKSRPDEILFEYYLVTQ